MSKTTKKAETVRPVDYRRLPEPLVEVALAMVSAWAGVVPKALHKRILEQTPAWREHLKNGGKRKLRAEVFTAIRNLPNETVLAVSDADLKRLKIGHVEKMRRDCLTGAVRSTSSV